MDPASRFNFYADACSQKSRIAAMEREFGPVVVGEWSLATDNCAMWLNGFNDNLPGKEKGVPGCDGLLIFASILIPLL
jgi:glucan 1,3-beta-glucosidase